MVLLINLCMLQSLNKSSSYVYIGHIYRLKDFLCLHKLIDHLCMMNMFQLCSFSNLTERPWYFKIRAKINSTIPILFTYDINNKFGHSYTFYFSHKWQHICSDNHRTICGWSNPYIFFTLLCYHILRTTLFFFVLFFFLHGCVIIY